MKSRDVKSFQTMPLCVDTPQRPFSPAYLFMTDLGNDPNPITVICLRKPTPILFLMFTVTPVCKRACIVAINPLDTRQLQPPPPTATLHDSKLMFLLRRKASCWESEAGFFFHSPSPCLQRVWTQWPLARWDLQMIWIKPGRVEKRYGRNPDTLTSTLVRWWQQSQRC